MLTHAPLALLHANADLFVGLAIGIAIGLLAGPLLRSWLVVREWHETSREARLTDELISRFDRDLDELPDLDDPSDPADPDRDRTWPTSR